MPWLLSVVVSTDPGTGSLKLGQPVPLSNFRPETNKLLPAAGAFEAAGALLEIQRAASRPLGAVLTHDVILLGREQRTPFGVGMGDRIGLGRGVCHGPNMRVAAGIANSGPLSRGWPLY